MVHTPNKQTAFGTGGVDEHVREAEGRDEGITMGAMEVALVYDQNSTSASNEEPLLLGNIIMSTVSCNVKGGGGV